MTITLELTSEEETILRKRADRAAMTPEQYLRRSIIAKRPKTILQTKSLADRMMEVLGPPNLERAGTSDWSEIEAACDAL